YHTTIILTQPRCTPFPYTTLFRSMWIKGSFTELRKKTMITAVPEKAIWGINPEMGGKPGNEYPHLGIPLPHLWEHHVVHRTRHKDRKSTRLNSSHVSISYAVFYLK